MKWLSELSNSVKIGVGTAVVVVLLLLLSMCASDAEAVEPSDNGIWSNEDTAFQGFVVQYAPGFIPGVVFYWFTYDMEGNPVWFISENIPVSDVRSEQSAKLFAPMGTFLMPEGARGDPVGVLRVSGSGDQLNLRFGLAPIEGFDENCASHIPVEPTVSPQPPPIPDDLYPCQAAFSISRLTLPIPQLD